MTGLKILQFFCIMKGDNSVITYDYVMLCILKAIKNATGTSVIFSINITLIHFVFVLTSAPNVGERFTKT